MAKTNQEKEDMKAVLDFVFEDLEKNSRWGENIVISKSFFKNAIEYYKTQTGSEHLDTAKMYDMAVKQWEYFGIVDGKLESTEKFNNRKGIVDNMKGLHSINGDAIEYVCTAIAERIGNMEGVYHYKTITDVINSSLSDIGVNLEAHTGPGFAVRLLNDLQKANELQINKKEIIIGKGFIDKYSTGNYK